MPISHARTPAQRAEEERLFYVAVTRAAEVLRFSWARSRTFSTDPVERTASPFLAKVRDTIGRLEQAQRAAPDADLALAETRQALDPADDAPPPDRPPDPADEITLTSAIVAGLRTWRTEQARKAAVRPTVVLSDRAMHAVAAARPRTPDDLVGLAGLGPLARQQHGARLLEIVAGHLGAGSVPR